jgi:tetratricopeptide (TPR) repeat protein
MKNLAKLIRSLKPGEVKLVRHFYQMRRGYEVKKKEKLLVLVLAKGDCTDEEAKKYMYSAKGGPVLSKKIGSAFSNLKQRLRTDILNILLLQEGETRYRSPYARAVFDCRRMLLQGEVLLSRGVYNEAINLLDLAIGLAVKYELYAEQVQILDVYRTHKVMREDGKDFLQISDRITDSIQLLLKTTKAKHHHYEMTVPGLFRTDRCPELLSKGRTDLEDMGNDFSVTGSKRIGFYYHVSAIHYNSRMHNYEAALFHAKELLRLVSASDVFNADSYTAGANMEIANALLKLSRYDEAIEHAKVALRNFKPGMLNELMALEKLYFCYIRKQELEKAKEILQKAFANASINYNEFTSAKWWFFKAGLEFLKGDPERALRSLKECNVLMKDKTGWLLGYCTLEMMCRVENGNHDWFEYRSESLKKILMRHVDNKDDNRDKRIRLIFQVMKSLKYNDYDLKQSAEKEAHNLGLLAEGKGQYYWDPTGYELVRFDEWIKNKAQSSGKRIVPRTVKAA